MPVFSVDTPEILSSEFYRLHAEHLCNSYEKLTGKPLLSDSADNVPLIKRLFDAPFALLSHGTQDDPVFNFGNRTALQHFEFCWDEFITLPSRKSAEPVNREERARLLSEVTEKGFIENYSGIRISSTGKRFMICQAIVWNLYDDKGAYYGQAAMFSETKPAN